MRSLVDWLCVYRKETTETSQFREPFNQKRGLRIQKPCRIKTSITEHVYRKETTKLFFSFLFSLYRACIS